MKTIFLTLMMTPMIINLRAEEWTLGPFIKADDANPILSPKSTSEFVCPLNGNVKWESEHVFNPAAVKRDGKVYLIYRAQDKTGCSRLGLAVSHDGLHFTRRPTPVLYPSNDDMKQFESPGGCEDARIVEDENGIYVLTYTAYDGKVARLAVATSKDLMTWEKKGLAFDGTMRDEWTKSGSIVCKQSGDKFVAARVNGKYWMYFRDSKFLIAHSDDVVHWKVVEDEKGIPKPVVKSRAGKFDSDLIEPGPQAILKDGGILLLFNGVNARTGGDPSLPPGTFSSGQLLFSVEDPTVLLKRTDTYFLKPDKPFELTGQVGNVCFIEGMVHLDAAYYLYYGTADSKIAVAVFRPAKK